MPKPIKVPKSTLLLSNSIIKNWKTNKTITSVSPNLPAHNLRRTGWSILITQVHQICMLFIDSSVFFQWLFLFLFCFQIQDNSLQRSVAAITASIAALLKPAFSRARIPAIVVPDGEVTLSRIRELISNFRSIDLLIWKKWAFRALLIASIFLIVFLPFNSPGCLPVSSHIFAAPRTVWTATFLDSSRDRPAWTPPSESASRNW